MFNTKNFFDDTTKKQKPSKFKKIKSLYFNVDTIVTFGVFRELQRRKDSHNRDIEPYILDESFVIKIRFIGLEKPYIFKLTSDDKLVNDDRILFIFKDYFERLFLEALQSDKSEIDLAWLTERTCKEIDVDNL